MRSQSSRTIVAYLKALLSAHSRSVALSVLLLCILGLVNGVAVLLIVPLLEAAGADASHPGTTGVAGTLTRLLEYFSIPLTVSSVLLIYLLVVGVQTILQRWNTVLTTSLQQDFVRWMLDGLYEAILRSDWRFHLQSRTSDLMHSLHSDINRVSKGTMALLQLVSAAFIAIVHIILALMVSPFIAAATVICLMFFWPLLLQQNRMAREAGKNVTIEKRSLFSNVHEQLAGIRELKALTAESRQLIVFRQLSGSIHAARVALARAQANTGMVYTFGASLLLSGLVYLAFEVFQIPLSQFALICLIFARLMPKVRQMHMTYLQVLHMLPAFESATELRARCDAAREPERLPLLNALTVDTAITLSDVSFRYDPDNSIWALRDVTLTIPAYSTTAIVGGSGAGKSTLADVLMGLLFPERGKVLIDDVELDSAVSPQWRGSVGYVPQETFLLHDTILANLLWGQPSATTANVNEALQMAAADEFVNALPDGLNTVIGDRGTRLSGGERQRIALARALLRQPAVLILDEATSSLDAKSQQRIHTAIKSLRGKLTIVIIAHRLSTVRDADRVVVFHEGRMAESGKWNDLAARTDGRLRSLIAADEASAVSR